MATDDSEQKLTVVTADMTLAILALLLLLAGFGIYFEAAAGWYHILLEWFYSFNWRGFIVAMQFVFFVLDMALIIFVAFTLNRFRKLTKETPLKEAVAHVPTPKKEVHESWKHIRELANSPNPSDWNMAIIGADALLDDILQHLGYQGESTAERLKIVDPTKLISLERVWSAHRLRNMMAHDPLEQHTRETIIHALRSYEQALKELGMMEESQT